VFPYVPTDLKATELWIRRKLTTTSHGVGSYKAVSAVLQEDIDVIDHGERIKMEVVANELCACLRMRFRISGSVSPWQPNHEG